MGVSGSGKDGRSLHDIVDWAKIVKDIIPIDDILPGLFMIKSLDPDNSAVWSFGEGLVPPLRCH